MKKLLFILALAPAIGKAQAQQLPRMPHTSLAKITASGERLIGIAGYTYNATDGYKPSDSVALTWNWTNYSTAAYLPLPELNYARATTNIEYYLSADTMAPRVKYVNFFDGDGKITQCYVFRWNATTANWDSSTRTINNWSGAVLMDSVTQSYYPPTKSWLWRYKTSFTYSGSDLATVTTQSQKSIFTPTQDWVDNTRKSYTWSGGLLRETKTELYNTTTLAWSNSKKWSYTYGTGADTAEVLDQNWNTSLGSWVNYKKTCYKPSSIGAYPDDSVFVWNAPASSWVSYTKSYVTYTGGLPSLYTQWQWSTSGFVWGVTAIYYYTYSGGNISESGSYYYNPATATWDVAYFWKYDYNSAGSIISATPYNNKGDGTFIPASGKTNYYYETFTGIKSVARQIGSLRLFPNPAATENAKLQFSAAPGKEVRVVASSLFGQKLFEQTVRAGGQTQEMVLPSATWPAGIYFVNLSTDGKIQETLKLVKQ